MNTRQVSTYVLSHSHYFIVYNTPVHQRSLPVCLNVAREGNGAIFCSPSRRLIQKLVLVNRKNKN